MTDEQQPLILKNFDQAVADSPHKGHALMRNIDVERFPGAMKVKNKMLPMLISITQQTFTVTDLVNKICTAAGDMRTQAEIVQGYSYYYAPVTFTTTGTLPSGLSLNTIYFLIYITNTTFKVANTWANADAGVYISIADAGTGTHTVVPVPMGTINHIRKDTRGSGYTFMQDSNGRVWFTRGSTNLYLLTGNGTTGAVGNGLELFRSSDGQHTWLFAFRSAKIDVVDVFGNTQIAAASWTNDWQSLNSSAGSQNNHVCRLAQDNIIYFCDDRYVGSILEKPGQVFDPTNSATYTYNNQALNLPIDDKANCFEELGVNLLVGGLNFNKIYPWDRISPSFNLPIPAPEKGIYQLINTGNLVYVFAGRKGNIYTTQGTYCKLFKTIPGYISDSGASILASPITWGGVTIAGGAIVFGLGTTTSGNSGVYRLYPDGRLLQDNTSWSGSTLPTAIQADNDLYVIGYNGGADFSDTSRYAAGTYAAVYQSGLYPVGNKTQKAAFSQIEIQTATPASSAQMRVSYRGDKSSAFSTPGSANTFAADGATTSFQNSEWGVTDVENIQVQIEFDGDLEILEVRLNP